MKRAEALYLRSVMEKAAESLDDKTASTAAILFPVLKQNGVLVRSGTRINWNGAIKRASVDLWDREDSNPDNAPDLWENIQYRDGYRIIPNVITAGLVFKMDEYGWWGDVLYKSKLAVNSYTPEQYPDGWEVVMEGGNVHAD